MTETRSSNFQEPNNIELDHSNRYHRQELVSKFGSCSREKLKKGHVLIVGAGGLGSPVSLFLAGAGVGEITLVDHDTVSLSNLHRQILFQEADINKPKVDAAKHRLKALNSEIKINAINAKMSIENVFELTQSVDAVVDAADSFLVSYLLSDACFNRRIPLVSASVIGTHGYLGVFCGTKDNPAPSLRSVFPAPSSEAQSCATAGVTGPSVGVIGSYQAQETIKVLLEDPTQLLGKLMNLDLWSYQQTIIDFNSAPEPSSQAKIIKKADLIESDIILDVRTTEEVSESPVTDILNSIEIENIPLSELVTKHESLPKSSRLVCVCRSGQRALFAANWLLQNGFSNVAVTA